MVWKVNRKRCHGGGPALGALANCAPLMTRPGAWTGFIAPETSMRSGGSYRMPVPQGSLPLAAVRNCPAEQLDDARPAPPLT